VSSRASKTRASASRPRRRAGPWWTPEELATTAGPPTRNDAYVVVEEMEEELATVLVARWPRLDHAGRLLFSTVSRGRDLVELVVPAGDLARACDRHRSRHGQTTRSIRIGDVFFVAGLLAGGAAPSADPGDWPDIVDVTRGAREAAKAALYGAVAPHMSDDDLEADSRVGEVGQAPQPQPPAGTPVARPAL
jgi:hypothetical protein